MGQVPACPPCPTIFLNSLMKIRSNRPVSAVITVRMNFQNQMDKLGRLDANRQDLSFGAKTMQPPLIYRSVREQMEQLRDQTRSPVKSYLATSKTDQKIVDEYTSLIRSWQDQATPIQKLRLFTIDELIRLANLSGRFRVQASHRYTGEALRRCGFKQKRDWTAAGRNKRYWIWSK